LRFGLNPFFGGWVLLDLFGARFAGAGKDHSPVLKEEAFFGCEEGIRSTDDGAEGDSKKYFEGAAQSYSWKVKLPKNGMGFFVFPNVFDKI
jgi:hypothetical protein